jgi:hypothetical protein
MEFDTTGGAGGVDGTILARYDWSVLNGWCGLRNWIALLLFRVPVQVFCPLPHQRIFMYLAKVVERE